MEIRMVRKIGSGYFEVEKKLKEIQKGVEWLKNKNKKG